MYWNFKGWIKKVIRNIVCLGKFFSDWIIMEYVWEIWGVEFFDL